MYTNYKMKVLWFSSTKPGKWKILTFWIHWNHGKYNAEKIFTTDGIWFLIITYTTKKFHQYLHSNFLYFQGLKALKNAQKILNTKPKLKSNILRKGNRSQTRDNEILQLLNFQITISLGSQKRMWVISILFIFLKKQYRLKKCKSNKKATFT